MRWKELGDERCSVARTIAVIGESVDAADPARLLPAGPTF